MSRLSLLEDFGTPPAERAEPAGQVSVPDDESARLASWEQGYKAGWDDAVRAEAEAQDRIGAEFARTLQELSFTFHEARAEVVEAMRPLLARMTGTLFPGLAPEALAELVRSTLDDVVREAADGPLDLLLAPESRAPVEVRLSGTLPAGVRIVEDPTLGPGQARLRLGASEARIDLDGALEHMRAAVAGFYAEEERSLRHG